MVKINTNESGKTESLTISYEYFKNDHVSLMRRAWVGKLTYNPTKWEGFPFNIEFCKFKTYTPIAKNVAWVEVDLMPEPGTGKVWCSNEAPRRFYDDELNEITMEEAIEILSRENEKAA